MGESTLEVAIVEYEGGDRLNVPLYRLDQLERYRAAGEDGDRPHPGFTDSAAPAWQRVREKTRQAIKQMAAELLDLYARRKVSGGYAFPPDTKWQRELESSFLYEDTPDQRKATEEVKRDMEQPLPMDRLLVGDVGYGKTEIAVRAAFKAVQGGKQVAVLVPTTILAEQHGRTFIERLADFPVKIEVLSRFRTAKEQKAALERLASGQIDIVIGTHRLLSKDVVFKDLGLLVVDEEHRFGVKHKERLKALRLSVDVLTLTATPIPRTLHLSLAGLRDLTLIETPPRDRSPILTFVEPWDDPLLEEAFAREIDRGGQVFAVHNRIETIDTIAARVRSLAPRARVGVAHGQMPADELEDGDAPVRGRRGGHPGLHHDRGVRARRAQREHDGGARRPPLRPGPALSAAGAGGPEPPAGLLLPAGARHHRCRRRGTAQGAGASYRPGGGLPHRAQGPRDPGRGQPARGRAVGACPGGGIRPLSALAGGDGPGPSGAGHRRAAGSARGGAGPAGPSAGRLHSGRRRQAGSVPATGASCRRPAKLMGCEMNCGSASGPCRTTAETLLDMARLRVMGAALGLQNVLVRGDEARLTFRPGTRPGSPGSPPHSMTCSWPRRSGAPCPSRSG